MKGEIKRDRGDFFFFRKMFQNPQTRQMNQPNMFRKKKNTVGRFLPPFSEKVQNLVVFSFIYMIRIRFFGPRELNQKGFSGARYSSLRYVFENHTECLICPALVL